MRTIAQLSEQKMRELEAMTEQQKIDRVNELLAEVRKIRLRLRTAE